FTRQEMAMQAEVGALVWAGDSDRRRAVGKEHALIVDAIRSGDTTRARALAEDHVRRDMNGLIDLRMSMEPPPPGPPPGNEDIDRTVSAVKLFTVSLEGNVAASIKTIEEAVQTDLDHTKNGTLDELTNVYDAALRNLARAMPAVYGNGFAADPSFFGEMGFIWCYLPSDPESPQRMELDLEFYDYSTAPWWPGKDTDEKVHASYAYVDAFGANEYLVTFTKPVIREGRMVGVAAVDILVRGLQAGFDPFLRSLPSNTCIVDQNDVVIATNTAKLLGGTLPRSHQTDRRITLPPVPWTLYIGVSAETGD
ncbi:MAG: FCD domain-containing protein, partial [Actinomycetota bacterium]|nr:FCD domain-containing protein [Actinomycetota bacterium]